MNYLTQKNERIARRKARVMTALIMLAITAGCAYFGGAFDAYFADPDTVKTAVATATAVRP